MKPKPSSTHVSALSKAASQLSGAAKIVSQRKAKGPLSISDTEKIIALGTSTDWFRWAAALNSIRFQPTNRQSGERVQSMIEITRFYYVWTGANALFGRNAIILALESSIPKSNSELSRFRILFKHAKLAPAIIDYYTDELRKLLFSEVIERSGDAPTTILSIIYKKYTDSSLHFRSNYRVFKQAIATSNPRLLDLPLIIYATRNWLLHGSLLNTSFRGPPQKFEVYINIINRALADVIVGASTSIKAKM